jgi:hypothetical protein
MPSYLFNDNLQSYTPGPNQVPNGFQLNGITFTYEFINGSTSPTPSPVGFYENTGIYYYFYGTYVSWPIDANLSTSFTAQTSVAWWGWAQDPQIDTPGSIQLASTDPSNPTVSQTLLTIHFETDNSVSFIAPGAPKVNSLVQSFQYNTWQYYSLTTSFSSTIVGGVQVVTVTASLYLNGVELISSTTLITTVPVSTLWNISPGVNQWNFQSGVYGYLGATNDIEPLPFYTNPSATINVKSPQMIAEFTNLPSPPNARVAQIIAEIMQAVVPSTASAIWMDAEANLAINNSTWTDGD